MKAFQLVTPRNLDEALRAGSDAESRFIAGGTLLVDLMRLNVERPATVVDLSSVLSSQITWSEAGVTIGAGALNSDLAHDERIGIELPLLRDALLAGASPQLRNMASVGGNLLQRTRCPYFRDAGVSQCNKRAPGSGCAAREGYSRTHAVLGVSEHCIATHPSDMCVALLALEAVLRVHGRDGPRQLAIADFHRLPGARPDLESALGQGEIITEVWLPKSVFGQRSAYVKVRDRASFAFALASAAVALELDGSQIKQARVALGGVGTKPWRAEQTEQALLGKPAVRETFVLASSLAMDGAQTTPQNAFKVELGKRCVQRALERAGAKT